MYLLEGAAAPDHNTIARFRSRHLAACQEQIQQELVRVLMEWGEISFEQSAVFIDGTKIESVGNRYQFVWKKSVEKNYQKLQATMAEKLPGMLKSVGLRFYVSGEIKVKQLKGIRKRLYARKKQDGIEKVSGKAHGNQMRRRFSNRSRNGCAESQSICVRSAFVGTEAAIARQTPRPLLCG